MQAVQKIIAGFVKSAEQQLSGEKVIRWRAYTKSGKIVIIEGRQVIEIIDPKKIPEIRGK